MKEGKLDRLPVPIPQYKEAMNQHLRTLSSAVNSAARILGNDNPQLVQARQLIVSSVEGWSQIGTGGIGDLNDIHAYRQTLDNVYAGLMTVFNRLQDEKEVLRRQATKSLIQTSMAQMNGGVLNQDLMQGVQKSIRAIVKRQRMLNRIFRSKKITPPGGSGTATEADSSVWNRIQSGKAFQ